MQAPKVVISGIVISRAAAGRGCCNPAGNPECRLAGLYDPLSTPSHSAAPFAAQRQLPGHRQRLSPLSAARLWSLQAQVLGDACAEVGDDVGPVVVDRALLDEARHPLAEMLDAVD